MHCMPIPVIPDTHSGGKPDTHSSRSRTLVPVIPDTSHSERSDAVIVVSYSSRFNAVKSAFAFLIDPPFS